MDQCSIVRERMPELLTEALGASERESSHQHIEQCPVCATEWLRTKDVWSQLSELTELNLPQRVRENFLATLPPSTEEPGRMLSFRPRPAIRWLAQAAAAAVLIGGVFFAGRTTAPARFTETPATLQAVTPFSLTERTVVPASLVNPEIQGRPEIQNVRFQEAPNGNNVSISFDMTSHVTITGSPQDKSLVNLLSYVLQNRDYPTHSRSNAIQWVRDTYAGQECLQPQGGCAADPEIVRALANVLKNDTHEGVRIKAVEALKSLPPSLAPEARVALVEALRNDPNPAVRIKAVEGLANLAAMDANSLDLRAVDALREKAGQEDENLYVRVKAAEALSQIKF